ncbi:hypothetical protein ACUL41_11380 [Virgibacillus natechei]
MVRSNEGMYAQMTPREMGGSTTMFNVEIQGAIIVIYHFLENRVPSLFSWMVKFHIYPISEVYSATLSDSFDISWRKSKKNSDILRKSKYIEGGERFDATNV